MINSKKSPDSRGNSAVDASEVELEPYWRRLEREVMTLATSSIPNPSDSRDGVEGYSRC